MKTLSQCDHDECRLTRCTTKTPTDEQLNIAMCEWMGWNHWFNGWNQLEDNTPPLLLSSQLPNYLSDDSPRRLLNEAEARLTDEQYREYLAWLHVIARNLMHEMHDTVLESVLTFDQMLPIHRATARQRVIAILKTVKPELFR